MPFVRLWLPTLPVVMFKGGLRLGMSAASTEMGAAASVGDQGVRAVPCPAGCSVRVP